MVREDARGKTSALMTDREVREGRGVLQARVSPSVQRMGDRRKDSVR